MTRAHRGFAATVIFLLCLNTVQPSWFAREPTAVSADTQNSVCPFHGGNCCCLEMCRSSKASVGNGSCHLKTGFASDFSTLQRSSAQCLLSNGCKTTKVFMVSGLMNFLPVFSTPFALNLQSSYLASLLHEVTLSGDLPAPFRPPRYLQPKSQIS